MRVSILALATIGAAALNLVNGEEVEGFLVEYFDEEVVDSCAAATNVQPVLQQFVPKGMCYDVVGAASTSVSFNSNLEMRVVGFSKPGCTGFSFGFTIGEFEIFKNLPKACTQVGIFTSSLGKISEATKDSTQLYIPIVVNGTTCADLGGGIVTMNDLAGKDYNPSVGGFAGILSDNLIPAGGCFTTGYLATDTFNPNATSVKVTASGEFEIYEKSAMCEGTPTTGTNCYDSEDSFSGAPEAVIITTIDAVGGKVFFPAPSSANPLTFSVSLFIAVLAMLMI